MSAQDELYQQAAGEFGPALARLARAYEADAEKRRDLLQEVHLALWRSFEAFNAQCSPRTWVYRVAHNAAASYTIRQKRSRPRMLVSLEEVEQAPAPESADSGVALDRLTALIRQLRPLDRQVILSYLEGLDAVTIGDLTGLSAGNVATRIHRIKNILARQFGKGVRHAG